MSFRSIPQTCVLLLQGGDAFAHGLKRFSELFYRVTRGNVLGAIPVECFHMDQQGSLRRR